MQFKPEARVFLGLVQKKPHDEINPVPIIWSKCSTNSLLDSSLVSTLVPL